MNPFARRSLTFAGALLAPLVLVTAFAGSADAAAQVKKVAEKTFPFQANGSRSKPGTAPTSACRSRAWCARRTMSTPRSS